MLQALAFVAALVLVGWLVHLLERDQDHPNNSWDW